MTNQPEEKSSETSKSKRMPWNSIGILLSTFSIIILLFAFFFAYCRLTAITIHLAERVDMLEKNSSNGIQQTVQQLRDQLNTQEQSISELRSAKMGDKDDWTVAEAQSLVQLANDNLQMGSDVGLVIKLLQTADQNLSSLTDPKIMAVRKALATDIAALTAVPHVDYNGLYLRLSALKEQIAQLPLPARGAPGKPEPVPAVTDQHQSWWKRGLQQTEQALKQIVIVRYNAPGTVPFVPPGQQEFLYENLYSMLEEASWAVLNRQTDVFHASLQQASKWIKQYFAQDSSVTQAVLASLAQLQQINIHPAVPPITNSLQAFRDYK